MFPSTQENAVVSAKGGSALSEKPTHGERPRLLVGGTVSAAGNYPVFRLARPLIRFIVAAVVLSPSWEPDRCTDRELLSLCSAGVPHGGRHELPPTQACNRDLGGQSSDGAYTRRGNSIRFRDPATTESCAGVAPTTRIGPGQGAV